MHPFQIDSCAPDEVQRNALRDEQQLAASDPLNNLNAKLDEGMWGEGIQGPATPGPAQGKMEISYSAHDYVLSLGIVRPYSVGQRPEAPDTAGTVFPMLKTFNERRRTTEEEYRTVLTVGHPRGLEKVFGRDPSRN